MKKFWNWTNQTDNPKENGRTLFLNGTIADESWYDDDVTPQLFKDDLYADSGDVTVWLNSPGGDCVAAAQIYNMLKEYPGNVTIKIDGIAASAASLIAMAGDNILMSPVSMMMIHNPATIAIGDSEEMKKAVKMLDEVKESIMNAYEIKTGLARDKISKLMDAESWFNAKKAVELGFADKILFSDGQGDVTNDAGEGMAVSDEMSAPVMFSRQAVMNSMLSKLIPPKKPVEKRTPVDQLEKRLRLLSH